MHEAAAMIPRQTDAARELRELAEYVEWMAALRDASREYLDALPHDMRMDTIRRSLRRHSFFSTPVYDERSLIFLYQLRYGDDPTKAKSRR